MEEMKRETKGRLSTFLVAILHVAKKEEANEED